jgi:hypothetical protein
VKEVSGLFSIHGKAFSVVSQYSNNRRALFRERSKYGTLIMRDLISSFTDIVVTSIETQSAKIALN